MTFDYRWETTQPEVAPEQWPEYRRERIRAFEQAGANVPTPRRGWSSAPRAKPAQPYVWAAIVAVWIAIMMGKCTSQRPETRTPFPAPLR